MHLLTLKKRYLGFPGGHVEEGESVIETANRECIEEIKKNIQGCELKFLMINKIDDNKKEKQIICFAKIGDDSEEYIEENESVKKIVYAPINEIISKIGNGDLWSPIIESFKKWI
ncbi:MAG: NUDIX hydrolase [Candidatus Pacearchaeota archaeon]